MKTKKRNYIFLAVLMMGIAMMMTACADNDLASQTPIGGKIVGKWSSPLPSSSMPSKATRSTPWTIC